MSLTFTLQAFNGIGQAALWDVTLLLDSRPVIETDGIVEYNRTYIGRGGAGIGGQQTAVTHKPTSYLGPSSSSRSFQGSNFFYFSLSQTASAPR